MNIIAGAQEPSLSRRGSVRRESIQNRRSRSILGGVSKKAVAKLEDDIEDALARAEAAEERLALMDRLVSELEVVADTAEDLLLDKQKLAAELESVRAEKDKAIAELEESLTKMNGALHDLSTEADAQHEALLTLQDKSSALEEANHELQNANIELQDTNLELEDHYRKLESRHHAIQEENAELKDTAASLTERTETLQLETMKMAELEHLNQTEREKIIVLEKEFAMMRVARELAEQDAEILRTTLDARKHKFSLIASSVPSPQSSPEGKSPDSRWLAAQKKKQNIGFLLKVLSNSTSEKSGNNLVAGRTPASKYRDDIRGLLADSPLDKQLRRRLENCGQFDVPVSPTKGKSPRNGISRAKELEDSSSIEAAKLDDERKSSVADYLAQKVMARRARNNPLGITM